MINITIDDLIRVAGWQRAVEEGRRHFPEQRHTRSMANWFNSCRFFAPYYAVNRLFKFDGKHRDPAGRAEPPEGRPSERRGPEPKATAQSFRSGAWEEAFLTLTTNHFFKGTLYVTKPPIYRLRPSGGRLWPWQTRSARKNLSVPRGVNIFGIFRKWYGSNYQSLHYFVLPTYFICFQSWSDGTTCKKPEKIVWTHTTGGRRQQVVI